MVVFIVNVLRIPNCHVWRSHSRFTTFFFFPFSLPHVRVLEASFLQHQGGWSWAMRNNLTLVKASKELTSVFVISDTKIAVIVRWCHWNFSLP